MDSKHQQQSKIVPPSSSPTSQSKTKPNLEFNMTNRSGQSNKSTPSPTASTSFKLRKSMTLNNSNTIRKQQTPSSSSYNATTAVPATNSMTCVNTNPPKRNDQETLLPTSTQSRLSKPKSIYVNDNFDEFILENEFPNSNASHKLNETIVKSPKRDRDDIVTTSTNEANFTGVGGEKTPSLCSSTSSKIKITSYTLNHQNQIELQQQLRNSTNKSINRLAYSKSSSRNNLGATTTTVANSKSKLPINTSESNGNKAHNVKLCRVIKTDQASGSYALPLSARKRHEHEKSRNSIFISSASTLLTNETYSPNEDFILNSIDFTKTNNQHKSDHHHHRHRNINNQTFTEHDSPQNTRVSSRESSTKIIDSMASFIDELKDFVDDRLNDTTSQLEMANQRITGLYECFNFVASEFSLLKFQNDELLKELKQYYQTYGVNKNINLIDVNQRGKMNNYNKKQHQNANKPNEKKSSETSSAISSFPVKSNRKSKKIYSNRKNELSYSSTESSNSEFSSQNVSLKSFQSNHSSSLRPQSYQNFIEDQNTYDKKAQINNKRNDKKSTLIKNNDVPYDNDSKSHLTNSVNLNKGSFNSSINYYDNKNETNSNNNNNKSWLEKLETKIIVNEMRTSSQIDLDEDSTTTKLNVLKRNNFVSTELPSDEIYDGNVSERNNYFDENDLNSNEIDSNDLASSIENFGVDGEEEEEEIEVEEIEQIYVETRNERRVLTVDANSSTATNANDIRVEIVENETEHSNNNKENTNKETNRSSELLNEKINEIIASNVESIVVENSQLNVIPSPKVVHHINTSIAPFQSTLMNDFDNQYLWDYSDNNKFQKF